MSLKEFFRFLANPFKYRQSTTDTALNDALSILQEIKRGQEEMALNLDTLRAEVERAKTVQESAIALLQALAGEVSRIAADLKAEVEEDNTHVAALEELASKLGASTDALAEGIAHSDDVFEVPAPVETPVEEVPVETPVEAPVEEAPVAEEPVAEVPVEAPVEAPVEEVPVEAPVEEPVAEVPAEVPVEVPAEPVAEEEKPVE